jgi:type II secretory pathway component HofQ
VPGLHRLPLLGWLFQQKGINNDKTELLIFITANILPMNI